VENRGNRKGEKNGNPWKFVNVASPTRGRCGERFTTEKYRKIENKKIKNTDEDKIMMGYMCLRRGGTGGLWIFIYMYDDGRNKGKIN
jgi:hypothetical protein